MAAVSSASNTSNDSANAFEFITVDVRGDGKDRARRCAAHGEKGRREISGVPQAFATDSRRHPAMLSQSARRRSESPPGAGLRRSAASACKGRGAGSGSLGGGANTLRQHPSTPVPSCFAAKCVLVNRCAVDVAVAQAERADAPGAGHLHAHVTTQNAVKFMAQLVQAGRPPGVLVRRRATAEFVEPGFGIHCRRRGGSPRRRRRSLPRCRSWCPAEGVWLPWRGLGGRCRWPAAARKRCGEATDARNRKSSRRPCSRWPDGSRRARRRYRRARQFQGRKVRAG